MKVVATDKAPQAIGPYSQAIEYNGMVFTSGQIALLPDGNLAGDDIDTQTRQVLTNLSNVLEEAGSSLQKVIKTTIFLADMNDFVKVNKIYEEFFGTHKPARSTVAVKTLPKSVKIEIDCIAVK